MKPGKILARLKRLVTGNKDIIDPGNRVAIINALIQYYDYKSYLEVGIANKTTFVRVKIKNKICVDPDKSLGADYKMTSDEFFRQNKKTFDIIFLDGLHHSDQLYRDIINSLDILNDKGTIACHDCNPLQEEWQIVPRPENTIIWTGDCWKAFVKLRSERDDLSMLVVNTDLGCGIVQRGRQEKTNIDCGLDWGNFNKNREKWLNLVSLEDWRDKLK